jgi:preprotein translocase subunit SecB
MSENQKQPQFALKRVYLKDASLETPGAPGVFTKAWQPEVNLDINTRSTVLDEEHFEVVLSLTVTVKNEGQPAFLVEVQQAGIFLLAGLGEAETKHTLGAFCPNILFPYAREAIDNLAAKASFPALMLAPVNFDALYAQQLQRAQQEAEAGDKH